MEREYERKVCVVDKGGNVMFCVEGEDAEEFFRAMEDHGKDMLRSALRSAIIAEWGAVNQYEAMAKLAEEADEWDIAQVIRDIADEERKHVGEFMYLLEMLGVRERKMVEEGRKEASFKLLEYQSRK